METHRQEAECHYGVQAALHLRQTSPVRRQFHRGNFLHRGVGEPKDGLQEGLPCGGTQDLEGEIIQLAVDFNKG